MTEEKKTPKVVFAPGCFDNFDGTQEELDEMLAEIQRMVDTGELFEKAVPVDPSTLLDDLTDEEAEQVMDQLLSLNDSGDTVNSNRKLH